MDDRSEIGTIEIQRPKGIEIWNVTSGKLSIDKPSERYRLNFWVESNQDLIQRLEDTGERGVIFEIKLPFDEKPNFEKTWSYKYGDFKNVVEDDYGDEEEGYWDNFYYYSHYPLENIEIEILNKDDKYEIKVTAESDDPIDSKYGRARIIITSKLELVSEFNSYWMD